MSEKREEVWSSLIIQEFDHQELMMSFFYLSVKFIDK